MELQYVYQKKRGEFGRQCIFGDTPTTLIDDFPANRKLMLNYIWRDPNSQGVNPDLLQACHEVNTARVETNILGMNHTEGGWPKEVNFLDEEATARHRRKVQKEDNYNPAVLALLQTFEPSILQNNAVNIYQQYFTDVESVPTFEKSSARIVNLFTNPNTQNYPVNRISWSPPQAGKLAITYCNMQYQYPYKDVPKIALFEIANPNTPYLLLQPSCTAVCTEYHNRDANTLVSGLLNGQLVVWDVRKPKQPVNSTELEENHRAPITSIFWLNSKSGMECFSTSLCGQVKWWDIRKLNKELEILIVDFARDEDQSVTNSMGVTSLEYDPTTPMRFMLGTEHGYVISCNRKGRTALEKMSARYFAHYGPVLHVERNPLYTKNFLTVGDWTCKIFNEDCRESPTIWSNFNKSRFTCGGWSPTRACVYFLTRSDGVLDIWDILQSQQHPANTSIISNYGLSTLRAHEEGNWVAIGNEIGTTYIVEISENLTNATKNERGLLQSLFDREVRREKILEVRNREFRLKMRAKESITESPRASEELLETVDTAILETEQMYYEMIEEEQKRRIVLAEKFTKPDPDVAD